MSDKKLDLEPVPAVLCPGGLPDNGMLVAARRMVTGRCGKRDLEALRRAAGGQETDETERMRLAAVVTMRSVDQTLSRVRGEIRRAHSNKQPYAASVLTDVEDVLTGKKPA